MTPDTEGIGKVPVKMPDEELRFMRQRPGLRRAHQEDPMAMLANLFDVAILIGVGLLIFALSSFGLGDLLSKDDMTMVINPGQPDQKLVSKQAGNIKVLTQTGDTKSGSGVPVGTVYKLNDGSYVWMPEGAGQ